MTEKDIDKFYPSFRKWLKEVKGYQACDGICLIKLWYEYLCVFKTNM